jgi:GNAT superfamily N-acetyltransferase
MSDVRLRLLEGADESEAEALWDRVFGRPRGGQSLAWLFREGPAGPPVRAVAELDGRIVAHAGVTPLRFVLDGEVVRGGYSVGAMTAPEARGRGLFFALGRELYAELEARGFAFVAGFSNAQSERLMTGPLGRTPIRPFPWCVRPLLPGAALLRENARAAPEDAAPRGVRACAPANPAFDPLWETLALRVRVGAVRDAAFAAWRFEGRPDAGYVAWCAEGPSGTTGLLVLRMLRLRGARFGFVVELLVDPAAPRAGPDLLRAAARYTRATGGLALSALLPGEGPVRAALRRAGFVRVPEALHPQVIRFSARGFGRYAGSATLVDPSAWLLSWADTDVV